MAAAIENGMTIAGQSWHRGGADSARDAAGRRAWPAKLLVVSLATPFVFSFGSVALSPYRLLLLAMLGPCLQMWLSGRAGKVRAADLILLCYCLWCALGLVVLHGAGGIEPGGILLIETFGAYLVARCYIRSSADFAAVARVLLVIVLILLPFAVVEALTGRNLLLDLANTVLPAIQSGSTGQRLGLFRVQSVFEHPILFGVFCSSVLAIGFLVIGRKLPAWKRWMMTLAVGVTAFLSLSSGPLTALAAQGMLLAWNGLLRRVEARWRLLWAVVAAAYLVVELGSSQSVAGFYISRFAFDAQSAWYRLVIWEVGWASVQLHPLFGVGFGDWPRPSWMTGSIDMFWLVPAIRHGIPAYLLMLAAFAACIAATLRNCRRDDDFLTVRTAYLITLAGFFLVGWTVHFWNAVYVLFIFLLGSGIWLADAVPEPEPEPEREPGAGPPAAGRRDRRPPRHPVAAGTRWQRHPVPSREKPGVEHARAADRPHL